MICYLYLFLISLQIAKSDVAAICWRNRKCRGPKFSTYSAIRGQPRPDDPRSYWDRLID